MTDTNSGITIEEGKANGIFVLPMPVIIDGEDYLEESNITHEELYEAMIADKDVMTSQPSPGDLLDFWDDIFEQGYDEIVYIPMSSGLSGSCHTSTQFAEEYDGKVKVVDNHRISVTLHESVYQAKKYEEAGKDGAFIKEALEKDAFNSSIYIAVESLKYLKKSGRVTAAGAMLATAMNIKPVLTIQGEKLDAFAKVRGMKAAQTKMINAMKKDIEERFSEYPIEKINIGVAGTMRNQEDTDEWFKKVQEAFPGYRVFYNPLSCSIACHVGIDTAGIGVSIIDEDI